MINKIARRAIGVIAAVLSAMIVLVAIQTSAFATEPPEEQLGYQIAELVMSANIEITAPTAGASSADAPQVTVTGNGIDTSKTQASWSKFVGYSTDTRPFTFEEGSACYAVISLYPEDEFEFLLGDPIPGLDINGSDYLYGGTVTASGGEVQGKPSVRTQTRCLTVWLEVMPEPSTDVSLTIHWSSVDGEDLMDPVVINVEPGTTVEEAVASIGETYGSYEPFKKDGYVMNWKEFFPKTLTTYINAGYTAKSIIMADVFEALMPEDVINENTDVYAFMYKALGVAPQVSVEAPVCGMTTETQKDPDDESEWDWNNQTNAPKASAEGAHYHLDASEDELATYWIADAPGETPFIGTFVGDTSYFAEIWLIADLGYYFDQDVASVSGADRIVDQGNHIDVLRLAVQVTAVHNWGEWAVTKPASNGEDGVETRTCAGCGKQENRATSKQGPIDNKDNKQDNKNNQANNQDKNAGAPGGSNTVPRTGDTTNASLCAGIACAAAAAIAAATLLRRRSENGR